MNQDHFQNQETQQYEKVVDLQRQNDDLTQRVAHLEELFNKILLSDKYLFQKPLVGGPNGLRLGSNINDKLAFYASAPVAQWNSGTGRQDITPGSNTGGGVNAGCEFNGNTGLGTIGYSIGDIVAALKAYGLLAT